MPDAGAATAYDAVAYPTALFAQTAPDRLAMIATLAGLSPPPVATARVLEIAAGDGLNLIALAAAWPDATFVGFDLAASAVARGNALIAAAELTNVRLEVFDIVDAAEAVGGEFDYVIAHGVYAWVPPRVRDAVMALIGRVLSPHGVGYVSYNAMPGGYLRLALRDALLFAVADVTGEARVETAMANLEFLAKPLDDETVAQAAMRYTATRALQQPPSVLFHDELGEEYHPQALRTVAAAAAAVGLRFLGDAGTGCLHHAFLPDGLPVAGDPETALLDIRQAEDYRQMRFFRSTVLVREAARPVRRVEQAAMGALFAACAYEREDARTFRHADGAFEIDDPELADLLGQLVDAWPARVPVADLAPSDAVRTALFELCDAGHIALHTTPIRHAAAAGTHPRASALARAMAAADATRIATLDHRLKELDDDARALLILLNGKQDRATLRETITGLSDPAALDAALAALAHDAMLLPDRAI